MNQESPVNDYKVSCCYCASIRLPSEMTYINGEYFCDQACANRKEIMSKLWREYSDRKAID